MRKWKVNSKPFVTVCLHELKCTRTRGTIQILTNITLYKTRSTMRLKKTSTLRLRLHCYPAASSAEHLGLSALKVRHQHGHHFLQPSEWDTEIDVNSRGQYQLFPWKKINSRAVCRIQDFDRTSSFAWVHGNTAPSTILCFKQTRKKMNELLADCKKSSYIKSSAARGQILTLNMNIYKVIVSVFNIKFTFC